MLVGGSIGFLTALLSFNEHFREKRAARLKTMTTFEHSFEETKR
jgi:hypothetical protein